jgi:hypothetical protein
MIAHHIPENKRKMVVFCVVSQGDQSGGSDQRAQRSRLW